MAIKNKIKSALIYPVAVMVVAFVVLTVIMIFVIPAFKDVFKSFGADLPAPTLVVIAMSKFFVTYWYLIFGILGGGIYFFLQSWKRSEKMQKYMDRLLLRVPVFGDLVNKSSIARWTRTLSTMFAAGVPLVEALDSVGGASGNAVFAEATEQIQKDVSTGSALTTSMQATGVFPMMVLQMCADRRGIGLARPHARQGGRVLRGRGRRGGQGPVEPDGAVHHRHPGRADRRHRRLDVPADLQAGRRSSEGADAPSQRSRPAVAARSWPCSGSCIGSFLNVVIHRLPLMLERGWKMESAELLGVAHEERAGDHAVDAALALPLVRPRDRLVREHSGRSAGCGCAAAARRAGAASRRATRWSSSPPALLFAAGRLALRRRSRSRCCGAASCAVLVALAGIDWDTTLLPDNLTLPLLWAGLVARRARLDDPARRRASGARSPATCRCGRSTGCSSSTTGKEGMGFGDFKLLAALGAWLGWKMILPIVLGASVIGAVVGIAMKLSAALREGRYVPFGPFLAGAGLVVMLAGPDRVLGWLRLGLTRRSSLALMAACASA